MTRQPAIVLPDGRALLPEVAEFSEQGWVAGDQAAGCSPETAPSASGSSPDRNGPVELGDVGRSALALAGEAATIIIGRTV